MGVALTVSVEAYLSGSWTAITADTKAEAGPILIRYGIDGSGPKDCIASPGSLSFPLRNDAGGSGGVQGYYSANHANKRTGWGFGIPVRVRLSSGATSNKVKFLGKIAAIDAEPGRYGRQTVHVTGYDVLYDLLEADVSGLEIAVNDTEDDLIDAILAAAPASAQPAATSFDAGLDTIPYAFDNLGESPRALAFLRDVVLSAGGLLYLIGDGTLVYKNRQNRATTASTVTLNDTMHAMEAPASLNTCFNRARVTTHPKSVSAASTDELYELGEPIHLTIGIGETYEFWISYTDPDDRSIAVGGVDVLTPTVPDEYDIHDMLILGSSVASDYSLTFTPFATTALVQITNDSYAPKDAYLMSFTVLGKAVRTLAPVTYEASVTKTYDRMIALDLPYQSSAAVGQGLADFIATQYADIADQIASVTFTANDSDALMQAALNREPGDRITITETLTGLSADAIIHSVELEIASPAWLTCTWRLAPADAAAMWSLDVDGFTELGETTVLGF